MRLSEKLYMDSLNVIFFFFSFFKQVANIESPSLALLCQVQKGKQESKLVSPRANQREHIIFHGTDILY